MGNGSAGGKRWHGEQDPLGHEKCPAEPSPAPCPAGVAGALRRRRGDLAPLAIPSPGVCRSLEGISLKVASGF